MKKVITSLLCCIGIFLLSLNIWGVIVPNDLRDICGGDAILPYPNALQKMKELPHAQSSPIETARKLTILTHKAMTPPCKKMLPRVPARQNYLLYLAAYADDWLYNSSMTNVKGLFTHYRMMAPYKALQRGVGKCGQQALTLAGLAQDILGWKSDIVSLGGHIVTQLRPPGSKGVIADPLYGIIIPMPLNEAERDQMAVAKAYAGHEYIVPMYTSKNNLIFPNGAKTFNPKLYKAEHASYILIWILPMFLIAPTIYAVARKKR